MDFVKDRFHRYDHCILSWNILCKTGNEDETCFQRHTGWYPDHASGTSSDSGRFHSASDIQSETSIRSVSAGYF